jgi:hypothetical protein
MVEWAWAYALFELDAYITADPVYKFAVRADELPLPQSAPHAMSHEGRWGEHELARWATMIFLVMAAPGR